jgi:hypothetical protein
MIPLATGLVSLLVAVMVFWRCLPDGSRMHPIMGTRWEPYFGVLVTFGISFGLTLMALGLTEMAAQ